MSVQLDDTAITPFGLRLKRLRYERDITQRWLAKEVGVSYGCICQWERGYVIPNAANLCSLSDVFGLTMDELWRGLGRCES